MLADHPDVPIITAALDERLNENNYIIARFWDAGTVCFQHRVDFFP